MHSSLKSVDLSTLPFGACKSHTAHSLHGTGITGKTVLSVQLPVLTHDWKAEMKSGFFKYKFFLFRLVRCAVTSFCSDDLHVF